MLKVFRADLHLHTCLSPCADEEMIPLAIVNRAKKKGLDVIGICDHNSIRNIMAVRRAGWQEGLAVIGGIEVTTTEEVHILALFDQHSKLDRMQQLIDQNLRGENNPELFGEQFVCDENGSVIGQEMKLLIGATDLSVEDVVKNIQNLGGLAIASHIDRERFSLISQLGFIPEGLQIDGLEVSPLHSVSQAAEKLPQIRDYPLVSFSDAHRLEEIGSSFTTFTGVSPCVRELGKALVGKDGREVIN
jgi:PHP family Zn ribbon phosphoesterase